MNPQSNQSPVQRNGQMKSRALEVVETEVKAPVKRRRFTLEFKRRIVQEADSCTESGQVGALLRREGLYSSHLTSWRQLFARSPQKPGRKPKSTEHKELERLRSENAKMKDELRQARLVIDVQKKLSQLLAGSAIGDF